MFFVPHEDPHWYFSVVIKVANAAFGMFHLIQINTRGYVQLVFYFHTYITRCVQAGKGNLEWGLKRKVIRRRFFNRVFLYKYDFVNIEFRFRNGVSTAVLALRIQHHIPTCSIRVVGISSKKYFVKSVFRQKFRQKFTYCNSSQFIFFARYSHHSPSFYKCNLTKRSQWNITVCS